MVQSSKEKAMMTRIKNKFGTFTWNPKSFRINQVVKVKDISGRHGDQIGTVRIAFSEATTPEQFKKAVDTPLTLNGKPLGVTRKGDLLQKKLKVISV